MSTKIEIADITKKRIAESIAQNKRFDGRGIKDFRKIEVEYYVSKKAEGSVRVKFGDTEVIAGVKLDTAEPYADSSDEGVLMTTAEFLPLASQEFEPGPPKINSIELARVVDRGVRESGFIDFKKLCIKKGEKVWMIFLDLYTINQDGNLLDAACFAAIAALKNTVFPKYNEKDGKVKYGELTNKKLPLTDNMAIATTIYKINENLFVDPTLEEEKTSEARLTIAVSKPNAKEILINAMQKGGEEPLSERDVINAVNIAEKNFDVLNEILKKSEK